MLVIPRTLSANQGHGAWDDEQLKDHYENRLRVLWLWASYCYESPGDYDYFYLD